jgi:predicted nucleic acid-binding Zn ribbon protein
MKRRRQTKIVSAGSVLRGVLGRYGLNASISRHNVVTLWPKIIDAAVARHVKAEKVTGATLHLEVDSSVWMNELAAMKHVLLEKVNAALEPGAAKITDIRFRQRSWAKSDKKEVEQPLPPEATEQELRLARTILAPVTDDSLRDVMSRILDKDRKLKSHRDT